MTGPHAGFYEKNAKILMFFQGWSLAYVKGKTVHIYMYSRDKIIIEKSARQTVGIRTILGLIRQLDSSWVFWICTQLSVLEYITKRHVEYLFTKIRNDNLIFGREKIGGKIVMTFLFMFMGDSEFLGLLATHTQIFRRCPSPIPYKSSMVWYWEGKRLAASLYKIAYLWGKWESYYGRNENER